MITTMCLFSTVEVIMIQFSCASALFKHLSSQIILALRNNIFTKSVAGSRAVLSLQTPVTIEGQIAQACLSLTRLDRLLQGATITLSTISTSSTATGEYITE